MKTFLKTLTGFYPIEKAHKIADDLQKDDPDFDYHVKDCENGLGRIDVYDEAGILIEKGFFLA